MKQLTRFLDIHGVTIREGDIVNMHYKCKWPKIKEVHPVVWDEEIGDLAIDGDVINDCCIIEVIGNVHHNPELLEA